MDSSNSKELSLETVMPLIEERLSSGQSVKFSPKGVSMMPMLRQGVDSVLVSPVKGVLKKYDIALYRRDDGKYILHRIVKVEKNYICIGDNQYFPKETVKFEQVIAVVTLFFRKNKQHSVDEFSYKLYCRLWNISRFPRWILKRINNRLKRMILRKSEGRAKWKR
ncbi:MAG: hypothetical protein E7525_06615 [Ruminococcaceae bacterium]|nr:hypothetical protein [Oscillospiraceae bacterium]